MLDWAEYRRACDGAVLFDFSSHGKIEVGGKDAAFFLHNLCTNDVKRLKAGEGCETFFTNAKARLIAHSWIQCLESTDSGSSYFIDAGPGRGEALFKHLNHFLISEEAEITNRTAEWALFHLAGPRAGDALRLAENVSGKQPFRGWRHDRIALEGRDLLCTLQDSGAVRLALERGQVTQADEGLYEVFRVEAGVPAHGAEWDDSRQAMELGRTGQAISYTKGCYLGQETIVMARDRGHVNRTLMGLELEGEHPVQPGASVFRGEEEIGQVTSSIYSPRLGSTIGLAILRRGHQEPGTSVEIETPDGRRRAEVVSLPFIKAA